jgi:CRP-like cAMP-binding protein
MGAATEQCLKAKSVVQSQGDPADRVWLLTEGTARHFYVTESGQKVILLLLRTGDTFGGRALLSTPSTYLVGTETMKDCTLLMWHGNRIRELCDRFPRIWENAVSIASDYLTWYLSTHLALITQEARERLAEVLLTLSEGIGWKAGDGLELNITNEELANTAHVTLFTVSRVISEWRRNGVLTKARGKIVLSSPERLRLLLKQR